jgi:Zn-dependent peptidase ImmA (M78 family)
VAADRNIAKAQARHLVAALDPDVVGLLATKPAETVEHRLGIRVVFRPEAAVRSGCSVAGSYEEGPPPRITVAMSASPGRRNFTILHELGHDRARNDPEVVDLLTAEPDGGGRLEEQIADAVAAELLLPDSLVDEVIGARGPTAAEVADLFDRSQASREACCVRAAQRIVGAGYVMLAEGDTARFTATANTPYRVARGTSQGDDHLVARAARLGAARGEARIRFRSGAWSDPMHTDATARDGCVFAVFVAGRAAWQPLSILSERPGPIEYQGFCGFCHDDFSTWERPCSDCGDPRCPNCGRCSCAAAVPRGSRQCSKCQLVRPRHLFHGESTVCDDCH